MDDDEFEEWVHSKQEEEDRWWGDNREREQAQIDGAPQGVGAGVWPDLRPEGMQRVHVPLIAPPAPPEEGDEGPSLKELLKQALERKASTMAERAEQAKRHHGPTPPGPDPAGHADEEAEEVEEEIMLITLEQDEDGQTAIYVDGEGQGGGTDRKGGIDQIPDGERELLMKAVKDFLRASDEERKGKRKAKGKKEDQLGWLRDEL
jgi:hypothetical protein